MIVTTALTVMTALIVTTALKTTALKSSALKLVLQRKYKLL